MQTATVTVAFVNPPAQGRKQGNIKTDDGNYYGVQPSMLGLFSKGGKYEINFDSREYNGKTYHTVTSVKALGGGSETAQGGGKGTDPATSENIFVCGIMNALASSGSLGDVTPENIALLTNNLRMGWRRGLVPASKPASTMTKQQSQDDMNDEIPF